ncbi:MAG: hypothetical protein EBR09_07120 [Proteobacteria bacterium]|nr:hypothetical protein [Pseudomonadota bacterium]
MTTPLRNFLLSGIFLTMCSAVQGFAGGHKVVAGASAASGGSNPITFSPTEISYTFVNSARDREFIIGFAPGIGYAVRFNPTKSIAVSIGGIGALSTEAYLGLYSGFGWEFWCPSSSFCLTADFRTSTALYTVKNTIPALSTVSIGGTLWTN